MDVGTLFFWFLLAALVGWWASKRGRLFLDYFLLSVVLSPLLGAFVLLVKPDLDKEGKRLAEKKADEARREEQRKEDHERQAATISALAPGAVSVADELIKLAQLRDSGVLTDDEFAVQKAALLAPK